MTYPSPQPHPYRNPTPNPTPTDCLARKTDIQTFRTWALRHRQSGRVFSILALLCMSLLTLTLALILALTLTLIVDLRKRNGL